MPSKGALLVDLDATLYLQGGPIPIWVNRGSLPGDFISAGTEVPQAVEVGWVSGIQFRTGTDGASGTHYVGPIAPAGIVGSSPRTVEVWVYDSTPQAEETLVAWGRRGGPDGSSFAFGHGQDPGFGAALHWGAPDMGWGTQIAFGRWTYLAYTYDPVQSVAALYFDGRPAGTKTVQLNTWKIDNTLDAAPLKIRIGRQTVASGAPSRVGIGDPVIARLRIHDRALSPSEIDTAFQSEAAFFGVDDSDGDGLPSWFERRYVILNPSDPTDADLDFDNDGLSNLEEFTRGTPLDNPDADGDGATDGQELLRMIDGVPAPTNPFSFDTDQDGVSDGQEMALGTDPLLPDTDGDGVMDGQELLRNTDALDAADKPSDLAAPRTVVELDATLLPAWPLYRWSNQGRLGGVFVAGDHLPALGMFAGIQGVVLDSGLDQFTGPPAPLFLAGNASRSVEAWIYNEAPADEETIIAWGRRGPGEGSNCAVGQGSSPVYGAVGHWGAADLGWGGRVIVGRWTHVAYVFDGTTGRARVYSDGVLASEKSSVVLNTAVRDNTAFGGGLPFRVGAQNDPDGRVSAIGRGSLIIGRIRISDGAFSGDAIAARFREESLFFGAQDADSDGIPDSYEVRHPFLNPNDPSDASRDFDGDGLSNVTEFRLGTDPSVADTDGDGVSDGAEVHRTFAGLPAPTDPRRRDTDGDGLSDGVETGMGSFVSPDDTGSDPTLADSDLDGYPDGQEVWWSADPSSALNVPEFQADAALIELDAQALPVGELREWVGTGLMPTRFSTGDGQVNVVLRDGVKGVQLDPGQPPLTGPVAPVSLTGNSSRSVEAWVFNPTADIEEPVVAWGRRGGGRASNFSFGHGQGVTSGALSLWGGDDMEWGGSLSLGRWTHIAFTYDSLLGRADLYSDGVRVASRKLGPLRTWSVDDTRLTNGLPIRIGSQNLSSGIAAAEFRSSLVLHRLRIFDQALSAADVQMHYQSEAGRFRGPILAIVAGQPDLDSVTLSWPEQPGRLFAVEASTDLVVWSRISSGNKDRFIDRSLLLATPRFYRIRLE